MIMAENRQNSETEKNNPETSNKTTTGGSAASTKQAKEENPKPNESSAKQTFGEIKESAGKITEQAVGQVKEKAASVIDEQKSNLAAGIGSVADSIRQIGEDIGGKADNKQIASLVDKYGDTLAGQVEKFSSYIEDKELKELVRDVETFARRNPALFVGGAFLLGVLAARFLKSSGSGQTSKRRSLNSGAKNSSVTKAVQPS